MAAVNPREERYAAEKGEEALARQKQAAKDYYWCCGEPITGPHHLACRHFVEDEAPPFIEGQESLL